MSDHHEAPAHNSCLALDDCIQASLRTLELARHSRHDNSLSQFEIESANVSLNQVIRAAESIKEQLRRGASHDTAQHYQSTNASNAIETEPQHERDKTLDNEQPPPCPISQQHDATSSSESSAAAVQTPHEVSTTRVRKLSTPCLTPIEPVDIVVRFK